MEIHSIAFSLLRHIGFFEEVSNEAIGTAISGSDKARVAERAGKLIQEKPEGLFLRSVFPEAPSLVVHAELLHALADVGKPGTILLTKNRYGQIIGGAYKMEGPCRTPKQVCRLSLEGHKQGLLSSTDIEIADDAAQFLSEDELKATIDEVNTSRRNWK